MGRLTQDVGGRQSISASPVDAEPDGVVGHPACLPEGQNGYSTRFFNSSAPQRPAGAPDAETAEIDLPRAQILGKTYDFRLPVRVIAGYEHRPVTTLTCDGGLEDAGVVVEGLDEACVVEEVDVSSEELRPPNTSGSTPNGFVTSTTTRRFQSVSDSQAPPSLQTESQ